MSYRKPSDFEASRHYLAGSSPTRMSVFAGGIRCPLALLRFYHTRIPLAGQEWRLAWAP